MSDSRALTERVKSQRIAVLFLDIKYKSEGNNAKTTGGEGDLPVVA